MRELLSLLRRRDVQGLFRKPTTNAMVQFFRYAFVGGFAALREQAVDSLLQLFSHNHRKTPSLFVSFWTPSACAEPPVSCAPDPACCAGAAGEPSDASAPACCAGP